MFFEEEKAALLQQIDSEFEKVKDEKPPAPIRRFKDDEDEEDSVEDVDGGDEEGGDGGGGGGGAVNMEDLVDRVNIRYNPKFKDTLFLHSLEGRAKQRKYGMVKYAKIGIVFGEIGEIGCFVYTPFIYSFSF